MTDNKHLFLVSLDEALDEIDLNRFDIRKDVYLSYVYDNMLNENNTRYDVKNDELFITFPVLCEIFLAAYKQGNEKAKLKIYQLMMCAYSQTIKDGGENVIDMEKTFRANS